jgi:hypothetical protein
VVAAQVAGLRLGERFCGPPATANGGYACGAIAELLSGGVEVTLRRPPPLGRPLRLQVGEAASLSPRPARPRSRSPCQGRPPHGTSGARSNSGCRGPGDGGLCVSCLIIRLIIQTIRRDPSRSDQIDEASNVIRPDRSRADQIDAEHQATDLAVGGSNPSRRAKPQVRGTVARRAASYRFWPDHPSAAMRLLIDAVEARRADVVRPLLEQPVRKRTHHPTALSAVSCRLPHGLRARAQGPGRLPAAATWTGRWSAPGPGGLALPPVCWASRAPGRDLPRGRPPEGSEDGVSEAGETLLRLGRGELHDRGDQTEVIVVHCAFQDGSPQDPTGAGGRAAWTRLLRCWTLACAPRNDWRAPGSSNHPDMGRGHHAVRQS